jgi:hypothetical protein
MTFQKTHTPNVTFQNTRESSKPLAPVRAVDANGFEADSLMDDQLNAVVQK